jgi:hypothetical protein
MEADRIQDARGVEGNVAPSTTQPSVPDPPSTQSPPAILKPQVRLLLPPSPKQQLRLLVLLQQLGLLQLRIGTRRKQLPPLALLKHGGFGSNNNLLGYKLLLNGSA